MKMLIFAITNLNKRHAETTYTIDGIYKKRRKAGEVVAKKAKQLGIDDQWDKPAVMDFGDASRSGYNYKYKILNVTEDVPLSMDVASMMETEEG